MQENDASDDEPADENLPLDTKWESAAEELIESFNLVKDADYFPGKYFRKYFYPNVGHVYFDELLAFTKKSHQLDEIGIVDKLALDAGTLTRWVSGSNPPAADKLLAVILLILKSEIGKIPFSPPEKLLFKVVDRQFRELANELCEKKATCDMDRIAYRTLMFANDSPDMNFLIPNSKTKPDVEAKAISELRKTKLASVLKYVNQCWSTYFLANKEKLAHRGMKSAPVISIPQLHQWIVDWGMAYALFALGTRGMKWGVKYV